MERSTYARCYKFPPILIAHWKQNGKNKGGENIGRERGRGELEGSRLHTICNKTRRNSFFFPNEKERKFCKKERRRGERGAGGVWRVEVCLSFFKGIINSLSALVLNKVHSHYYT